MGFKGAILPTLFVFFEFLPYKLKLFDFAYDFVGPLKFFLFNLIES